MSWLLQGWEAARDHARSAVETDNRLRRWLPGLSAAGPPAGLLYRCTLGNIDLTTPLGAHGSWPWRQRREAQLHVAAG